MEILTDETRLTDRYNKKVKMPWWKNFLFIADLSAPERALYRRWLMAIIPIALALTLLYAIILLTLAPEREALIFVGVFFLTLLGLLVLLWRGHLQLVSATLCLGTFAGFLVGVIRFGGVRGASYPTMIISIILAAMFLRARVAVTMGIIAILVGTVMLLAESMGWYQPNLTNTTPLFAWMNGTLMFLMAATLLGLAGKSIRTILGSFRNEIRERLRVENTLRETSEYLTALHATTLDIINRREILPLLESILNQAEQLVKTEHGYMDIVINEDLSTQEQVGHGIFKTIIGEITRYNEGATGQALAHKKTLRIENYNEWEYHRPNLEYLNIRAIMAVPLLAQEKPVGVIGLASTEQGREFSTEQAQQVEQLAELAALALDNALLHQSEQEKLNERQLTETALRESQERLNLALEAAKMGLWSWNIASGNVIWSDQAYLIFGLEADEFGTGLEHYLQLIYPADRERVVQKIEQIARGAIDEYSVEHRVVDKGGKIRWLQGYGKLTRNANNQPINIAGTISDITDSKRAERALRRADFNLERNAAALQRRSTLLQVGAEVSRAASAILDSTQLGQQVVELVRLRFALYYVGMFLIDESSQWAVLRAATGHAGKKMLTRQQRLEVGETSMVGWAIMNRQARIALDVGKEAVRFNNPLLPETRSEIALPLISRGQALGAITIQSAQEAAFSREDISSFQMMTDQLANAILNAQLYDQLQHELEERKAVEEEIRHLNDELEERVQLRTADLQTANHELEAFSYSVSHDLRAPLRAIDGFSHIINDDYAAYLPEEGRQLLNRVRRAAQEMGQLIDDILRLSRVTRTELRLESVNLSSLAREIGDELTSREPQRSVTLTIDENIITQGDTRLLRVALENLLNNAWKFSGKTEKALIHVGTSVQNNVTTCFVRDNGVGFDMAYADKLFGAFQRLHSADEFPGTGIGLAIVQRVIHRHGGEIWAESAPGQGTTFYFTLGA
ncbi:MAG: hypothetical protein CO094_13140 [Anaerolineae bacterium CG_4_9_14_3_um_filter_57_17]|nr:MAG: hypothetical protein CO094_13140 [Anaerolineae bacterium CG_4_9_14_3_um_filter_57_17]